MAKTFIQWRLTCLSLLVRVHSKWVSEFFSYLPHSSSLHPLSHWSPQPRAGRQPCHLPPPCPSPSAASSRSLHPLRGCSGERPSASPSAGPSPPSWWRRSPSHQDHPSALKDHQLVLVCCCKVKSHLCRRSADHIISLLSAEHCTSLQLHHVYSSVTTPSHNCWICSIKYFQHQLNTTIRWQIHYTTKKILSHSLLWLWFWGSEPNRRKLRFLCLFHFLSFLLTIWCFTLERHPRVNPEKNMYVDRIFVMSSAPPALAWLFPILGPCFPHFFPHLCFVFIILFLLGFARYLLASWWVKLGWLEKCFFIAPCPRVPSSCARGRQTVSWSWWRWPSWGR